MSERDTRVSLTMVRVCVLFLICNLPGCFILSLRLIEPEFDFYGVYKQSFDLAVEINEFSLVINSSANFLIYLRGSDDFRQTFCKMARTILPACCFRFLFRCVRRTEQDRSKTGSSYNNSEYFN